MHLLCCISFFSLYAAIAGQSPKERWIAWTATYSKTYRTEAEATAKRDIFWSNLAYFEERSKHDTAIYEPDEYADLTPEQFNVLRGKCFSEESLSAIPESDVLVNLRAGPQSIDWRDPAKNPAKVNAVTRVKDQGPYGYCWAFGATGALEGMSAIQQGNSLEELSEQELIDCCSPSLQGVASCWGRGPNMAWNFLINNTRGIDSTETSYPYQGHARKGNNNMTCALASGVTVNGSEIVASHARVASYVSVGTSENLNQDKILSALVKYGPGNIGVDETCLFGYKGGVISNCTGKSVDHATLVVGAGEDNGIPYWIVKNSWGPHWGEKGFYRMERNTGQCRFSSAAFPIAAEASPLVV